MYQSLNQLAPIAERSLAYCEALLGVPYGGMLDPAVHNLAQVRFELEHRNEFSPALANLDCVTLTETVLALLQMAPGLDAIAWQTQFNTTLRALRYHHATAAFLHRNHSMSGQWLPNNAEYLRSITHQLVPKPDLARCQFNWRGWLKRHPKLQPVMQSESACEQALAQLQLDLAPLTCELAYAPFAKLESPWEKAFACLPQCFVVVFVRPNWDQVASIGTHLNVSHLGFGIWQAGSYWLYHASQVAGKVVKQNLAEYCAQYRQHATMKGIALYALAGADR